MSKILPETHLFKMYSNYEKILFDALMTAEVVNKAHESFQDIEYEVKKRQINNSILKVLKSNNVVLLIPKDTLPKSFKVFTAKDIKGDKKLKVFIDCTGIISYNNGVYKAINIDILIAHLVNAMTSLIYYTDEKRLLSSHKLRESGAKAFSSMFVYIMDSLFKVNSITNLRGKCIYLSSMYFYKNIIHMPKDNNDYIVCQRMADLSDREIAIINSNSPDNIYDNIKTFIDSVSDILKLDKLTLDIFIEKWMWLLGAGTVFGLELFPSFTAIMTDTYVGCYLNNQKTIEKITAQNMVVYTKEVIDIGGGCL